MFIGVIMGFALGFAAKWLWDVFSFSIRGWRE